MIRHLARIVKVDSVGPILKADAIEVAQVGGWKVVVENGEFAAGDLAVYFEIDSFLPQGNPGWQFLIDKAAREFNGQVGHVLHTVTLRGQLSQGLLLPLSVLPGSAGSALGVGTDVTDLLGVLKYEPPVPECLQGLVVGSFPSRVPKTEQERVQNLAEELAIWRERRLRWEVTEKLEGQSMTLALIDKEFHVCAKTWSLADVEGNVLWQLAKTLKVREGLGVHVPGCNIALQGELVGPGVEGNIYRLSAPAFYLYDVYDVDAGRYCSSSERLALSKALGVSHVPLIERCFQLGQDTSMEMLLEMADGMSELKQDQRREGLVFKCLDDTLSFKSVSNKYLSKQSSRK